MINKKILLSLLFIGVVTAAAGSGTWAYFSDIDASTSNTLTAGTLVLSLDEVTASTWAFDPAVIAPNDEDSGSITVTNDGSLDGYLFATLTVTETDEDAFYLSDMLTITVSDGTVTNTYDYPAETTDMSFGALVSGDSTEITVTYTFDAAAGNDYQDESATFDLAFKLNQLNSASNT